VAVNSGGSAQMQIMARIDVLHAWIQDQIQRHGGAGKDGGNPPDKDGGAVDPPGKTPPPGSCEGPSEREPNDSAASANILGENQTVCANIGAGDVDYYTWSVAAAGVAYDVETSGGAVRMWKIHNGAYYPIANSSPTRIQNTSNGAGQYVIAVWSPEGQTGAYKLRVAR
jgi:hypothetical protein